MKMRSRRRQWSGGAGSSPHRHGPACPGHRHQHMPRQMARTSRAMTKKQRPLPFSAIAVPAPPAGQLWIESWSCGATAVCWWVTHWQCRSLLWNRIFFQRRVRRAERRGRREGFLATCGRDGRGRRRALCSLLPGRSVACGHQIWIRPLLPVGEKHSSLCGSSRYKGPEPGTGRHLQ
jgi:hypothetical protein